MHSGRTPSPTPNLNANAAIFLAALCCALLLCLGINSIMKRLLRWWARRIGPPGKAELRSIPVVVYAAEEMGGCPECPICLGEFLDGEKIRVLPKCRHVFHVTCIDEWVGLDASCPTCRRPVVAAGNGAEGMA